MSQHLLTVDSLSRESVDHLLRVAARMEPIASRRQVTRVLEGAVLGNLFFEANDWVENCLSPFFSSQFFRLPIGRH